MGHSNERFGSFSILQCDRTLELNKYDCLRHATRTHPHPSLKAIALSNSTSTIALSNSKSTIALSNSTSTIALSNSTSTIALSSPPALTPKKGDRTCIPTSTNIPKSTIALRRTLRERTCIPTSTQILKRAIAPASIPKHDRTLKQMQQQQAR
ncbi:hypothetical protein [Argonema antarcticum]|uniref:hypothetical protein n=1 Tax=Argonema antarcticum TaxID=2942763 RepID=UPI00201395E2|nr:hypothetical protein [Argonema antarcticum]